MATTTVTTTAFVWPIDRAEISDHELLVRTRALIEEYGHNDREYGTPATGFCVAGAAIWANGPGAGTRISQLIGFKSPQQLFAWNDEHEQTKADVLARLDAAIARTAPAPAALAWTAPPVPDYPPAAPSVTEPEVVLA